MAAVIAGIAFALLIIGIGGWLFWITCRIQLLTNRQEELMDRQDRNNAPAARPRPTPGPATVPAPAVQIIGGAVTGRTATGTGRHAKVAEQ